MIPQTPPQVYLVGYMLGGKIMLGYNGVLSIILWLIFTRGLKSEDQMKINFVHLLTGIVFVMLSLLILPSPSGPALVHLSGMF